jgi:hypothetical protein
MLPNRQSVLDYDQLAAAFAWDVPRHYNIGVDVCDKWAHEPSGVSQGDRVAILLPQLPETAVPARVRWPLSLLDLSVVRGVNYASAAGNDPGRYT